MRRPAPRPALAAALVALAAALLPGAAAATSFAPSVGFHLHHGRYDVSVGNLGETVVLTVEAGAVRSQRHVAATSYVVHGTATESRIEADFGELGELSMRFHPSRHRTWAKRHRGCRWLDAFLVRRGTWRGRLRFRGEGGYLRLDVRRARGVVEALAPQCRRAAAKPPHRHRARVRFPRPAHLHPGPLTRLRPRPPAGIQPHPLPLTRLRPRSLPLIRPSQAPALGREVPVVRARWRHGVAAAEFIGGGGREGSAFYAATEESRGRVAVFRSARAVAGPRAASADDALTRARLTPPPPFHRSARYRAAPDGARTWSGRLFVSFPGEPHYALTGGPFESSLELLPEALIDLIGILSG